MTANLRYCVNQPTVISETIDGEAIIINLDTGAYYSLREAGAAIWNLLLQGPTFRQVIDQLSDWYDHSSSDELACGLQSLLDELERENLILSTPNGHVNQYLETALPPDMPTEKRRFTPPALEKYTDMAELLLLDPIHEVDDAGWPAPKNAAR